MSRTEYERQLLELPTGALLAAFSPDRTAVFIKVDQNTWQAWHPDLSEGAREAATVATNLIVAALEIGTPMLGVLPRDEDGGVIPEHTIPHLINELRQHLGLEGRMADGTEPLEA